MAAQLIEQVRALDLPHPMSANSAGSASASAPPVSTAKEVRAGVARAVQPRASRRYSACWPSPTRRCTRPSRPGATRAPAFPSTCRRPGAAVARLPAPVERMVAPPCASTVFGPIHESPQANPAPDRGWPGRRSAAPADERQGSAAAQAGAAASSCVAPRSTRRPTSAVSARPPSIRRGARCGGRQARAMAKGSTGARSRSRPGRSAEVSALLRLAAAGVRVPTPYDFLDGVLMELVDDGAGGVAPRLNDVSLSPEQAREYHAFMVREVARCSAPAWCMATSRVQRAAWRRRAGDRPAAGGGCGGQQPRLRHARA